MDYTSGGVRARGPHEGVQAGQHPRHDYAEYLRRQAADERVAENETIDWRDLAAVARHYEAQPKQRVINIRAMVPSRRTEHDPLGRSVRRNRSDT